MKKFYYLSAAFASLIAISLLNEGKFGLLVPLTSIAFGTAMLYQLPTIIAHRRKLEMEKVVWGLNLAFGWTGIGLILLFIWACAGSNSAETINMGSSGPVSSPQPTTLKQQLEEIQGLLSDGLITQDEFDKKKAAILS